NLEIVILSRGVKKDTQDIFNNLIHNNIEIRFIDVTGNKLVSAINSFKSTRGLSLATYLKIFIPALLHDYDKVLYLDSDIIVLKSIDELLTKDIGNNLIGAMNDTNSYQFRGKYKNFVENVLEVKPINYINAGVILFNVNKCNGIHFTEAAIDFIHKQDGYIPFMDQDVINRIARHKIYELPRDWHITVYSYGKKRLQILLDKGRRDFLEKYYAFLDAAKSPKLLHYAGGIKPWNFPTFVRHGLVWHLYARETPFVFTRKTPKNAILTSEELL
ncbi:MAG: glycosyltransferase family 8 protein, partial [Desulfovibrio sp.]|nr:glycosyltransferase family 8 protein [Desulfovibrio sp.]